MALSLRTELRATLRLTPMLLLGKGVELPAGAAQAVELREERHLGTEQLCTPMWQGIAVPGDMGGSCSAWEPRSPVWGSGSGEHVRGV